MVKDAEAGTPYAPINIIPTFPFLGLLWGIGGDWKF